MNTATILDNPIPAANGDPYQLHYIAASGWTPLEYHGPAWAPMPEPPVFHQPCPRCKRPAKWFQLGNERHSMKSFQAYCKNHCEPDAKYHWINRFMLELGVPPAYVAGMTFDQFIVRERRQGEALEKTLAFSRRPGRWLALSGGTGCGKSHLAISALRAAVTAFADRAEWEYSDDEHHRPLRLPTSISGALPSIRFLRGSELFADLQAGYKANRAEIFRSIVTPALLIIDDMDTDYSKAEMKILENALDARYSTPRSTLFTTNLSQTEFFTALGKRTVSRLTQIGEFVKVEADDHRRKKPPPDPESSLKVSSEWGDAL